MTSNTAENKKPWWRPGAAGNKAGNNVGANESTAFVSRWPIWRRRLLWTAASLLLLWALAYALVPVLIKSQVEKIASKQLGRQVTLGAVDFKPWSLELTLYDLAIARSSATDNNTNNTHNNKAQTPQFSIKRIHVNAELESLLRLAPVIEAVQLDEPVLSLTHLGDGKYDIDDIVARLQAQPAEPAGEPARFALYNLVLSGGQLDFIDQPVGKTHELRDFNLAVPFLSNLKSKLEVKTSPRLAFKLNGSVFDTAAEGTPFAQTRKSEAIIKLSDFDVSPYLAYLPPSLPFRLQSAILNLQAKVAFEQTPETVVRVSGQVTVDKARLLQAPTVAAAKSAAGRELLVFDQLRINIEDLRPLEQSINLSAVELSAPTLNVARDRAGRLNLLPPVTQNATKTIAVNARNSSTTASKGTEKAEKPASPAVSAPVAAASASAASTAKAPEPWKVKVASVAVRSGRLNWLDESLLPSAAQIGLSGFTLDASDISLPFVASAPLKFKVSLGLDNGTLITKDTNNKPATSTAEKSRSQAAPSSPASLVLTGTATDQAAQITATVASWPLNMAAKYVGQFLLPALDGQLDATLTVNWLAASAGKPQALTLAAPQIGLRDVKLAQGKVSLVSVKQLELAGVNIDVPGQSFKAEKLQISQPKALVERDAEKRWMFERWMAGSSTAASAAPTAEVAKTAVSTADSKTGTASWAVQVKEVLLDGGAMSFSDRAGARPVALEVSAAKAQLNNLILDNRPAAAAAVAKPMPLNASLRLATGRFEPGKLDFKGSLALTPLLAQGQLLVERLPVQAFEPYFADAVNIELLRADASFKGRVAYRQTATGPVAQVAGDVALEEFKANSLLPSEDLLAWKALNLRGLNVSLDPAKPLQVDVSETVLTDFFARVIVTPEGRINLQDLMTPAAGSQTATAAVTPTASGDAIKNIAADARGTSTTALKGLKNEAAAAAATVSAVPATPASAQSAAMTSADNVSAPNAPIINFGPMSLINGKVLFSDRFVKPNYSADLTDLNGRLSAFSSVQTGASPSMADLELRGRAEGTASLEILGKLNPLAKPLALDIAGKVRDLELPPLSPYSVKYAGYGINRGKLSVDVNYLVLPNGQLTAKNKVILNQLSFGDKVEGATASLPVKLAVALLADRNGVIDIDLPISGSLNDPQFSIGPVIVKVILNLIVKAITAPFSLLASAFGGGEELSTVAFAPGSARLAPEAATGLDKVAKALTDRPGLRLTVVGTSSLEAERDGFRRERLNELVRAEKRRSTVKDGGTTTAVVSISPAEYPELLKEVYKRADIKKPRNAIGLARDLPVPEMESLLLADIQVNEDNMRELAVQRGVAVKDYLASRQLPLERLFLGAAKAVTPESKWTPRAELNLAMP